MLALLLLGLLAGAFPRPTQAQDSTVVAEGRMLNKETQGIYYYRIGADSTILIRQERPPADDAGLILPAVTLTSIYQRTEEQLLSAEENDEYLGVGYEGQTLVLRVSQRFDLYVLSILIAVLLLGGPLLAWLWWRLSKERRRRQALVRSRRYLTEGREKERKRLAKEIHDGPVQDLHGLHMQLEALLPDVPGADQLQNIGEELMRVTGELRALSADLHPPTLQRFGLAAALRSHADRLRDRHALQIDLDLATDCGPIPDEHALALFRVTQEALNNAAQHGNATRARVQFRCSDDTMTLDVRDDGDGFTPPADWHALAEWDHYGLIDMRERAEAIGADFDVDSAPGKGTRVRLRSSMVPSS